MAYAKRKKLTKSTIDRKGSTERQSALVPILVRAAWIVYFTLVSLIAFPNAGLGPLLLLLVSLDQYIHR